MAFQLVSLSNLHLSILSSARLGRLWLFSPSTACELEVNAILLLLCKCFATCRYAVLSPERRGICPFL
jgi:hypothetical protein